MLCICSLKVRLYFVIEVRSYFVIEVRSYFVIEVRSYFVISFVQRLRYLILTQDMSHRTFRGVNSVIFINVKVEGSMGGGGGGGGGVL